MIYRCAALLVALVVAAGSVPAYAPPTEQATATALPAMQEASWVFTDRGTTYLVGKSSGSVLIIRSNAPTPDPIKPEPLPPATKAAYFTLIVDPNSPDQASYRTDTTTRERLTRAGISFRTYNSGEADIASLNFTPLIQRHGLPLAIVQDASGKLIIAEKIDSSNELYSLIQTVSP